jgi:hypothetical protein
LPLYPGKEAFHQPAPFVASQVAIIICSDSAPISVMRYNYLNTILTQFLVQLVTVGGTVSNQILHLAFNHVALKIQLHLRDLVMVDTCVLTASSCR